MPYNNYLIVLLRLLKEMGYHKATASCSRATSPMKIFDEEQYSSTKEDTDHLSQEQYAALSLQHAEELKELQEQYEYGHIVVSLSIQVEDELSYGWLILSG